MESQLQSVEQLVPRGPLRVLHELQVKDLVGPLLLHDGGDPLRQVNAVHRLAGGLTGEELQHDHPQAVDVRLHAGLLELGQLRGAVTQRAGGGDHVGVGGGRHQPGEPVVGDLGVDLLVQQDVPAGQVPVDHVLVGVEVVEPPRRPHHYLHPRRPVNGRIRPSRCITRRTDDLRERKRESV